jgi:hypothetical protein
MKLNITIKTFSIILSFIFLVKPVPIPPEEWLSATHWTMYSITTANGAKFDRLAVKDYHSKMLDLDTMRQFLEGLTIIPHEKSEYAVWMGDYYVSCVLKDTMRIIRVSRYGGFFVDLDTGQYYEIPGEKRSAWHLFLVKQFGALKNFDNP